ncbi:MAG TPA: IPT/TIG domain-containing protein, partial [Caldilineaceae bacterium]|nr:IPT/TIG domain-containing protein [Caldilineaceae bacterium]
PQTAAPSLDGYCEDAAYAGGASVPLLPYGGGSQGLVRLIRTANHLYACFSGLQLGLANPNPALAALMIDPNFSGETSLQSGDLGFAVAEDGGVYTFVPNAGAWTPGGSGLEGVAGFTTGGWSAELRIERDVLGGWERTVGLAAGHVANMSSGSAQHKWPFASARTQPATWARAVLGMLPTLDSLSPVTTTVGGPAFTLTVTGTQLISSTLLWNDTALPTTVVSPTQLTAQVAAELFATPGTVAIKARTAGAAGQPNQDSNTLLLSVVSPMPVLASISPATVDAGRATFTLNLSGGNFLPGSTVLWNGAPLPTTVNSSSQATAEVSAALVAEGQIVSIAIAGPGLDAPVSEPLPLQVTPTAKLFLPTLQK